MRSVNPRAPILTIISGIPVICTDEHIYGGRIMPVPRNMRAVSRPGHGGRAGGTAELNVHRPRVPFPEPPRPRVCIASTYARVFEAPDMMGECTAIG